MHPVPPAVPTTAHPTAPPPGWYADPWAPPGWRWWDGRAWTAYAANTSGVAPNYGTPQPLEDDREQRWFPEIPSLPIAAAWLGIATMVVLTIGTRAVTALPEVWEALVSLVLLAGTVIGMPAVAFLGAKRLGSGNVRKDLGLYAKLDDTWVGAIGMVVMTIAVVATTVIFQVLGAPDGSNLTEVEEAGRNGVLFAFLFFFAGVVAPITEELLFRGLIQRGLTSKFNAPVAVVLQGLVFGAAHIMPSEGWGNVSLLVSLSVLGIILGGIAQLTGRLTAPIIAHALFNCFQLTLLWIELG